MIYALEYEASKMINTKYKTATIIGVLVVVFLSVVFIINQKQKNADMKKYVSIMLVCMSSIAYGQVNNAPTNAIFEIGEYQISPGEQIVYKKQMTSGSDRNGTDWWGYTYVPDKGIDFRTTSLIFMGSVFAFKESFPIQTADISSLKVIYRTIGYDNEYMVILAPLENRVHVMYNNHCFSAINISGYKHVRQQIFKERNTLFFIPFESAQLAEISIPVDEATLQHVIDNYYTDKNGLYYFDPYKTNSQQLETNNGEHIEATLQNGYFTYGNAAYPYGRGRNPRDLRMNASQVKVIGTSLGTYVGDGEKLCQLPRKITYSATFPVKPQSIIPQATPQEPINQWNCFDAITVGDGNLRGDTLYYPSKEIYAGVISRYGSLVQTPSNLYCIFGDVATKLSHVMIYNCDEQKYEPIEIDKFRRLTMHFYIYKNRLYDLNSIPVKTELDLEKLQMISLHNRGTYFYSDGKSLLGAYNLGSIKEEGKGKQAYCTFVNSPFQEVDWESLQVVDENILIDKNNIYKAGSSVLEIIPIKALGIDVKTIEIDKPAKTMKNKVK